MHQRRTRKRLWRCADAERGQRCPSSPERQLATNISLHSTDAVEKKSSGMILWTLARTWRYTWRLTVASKRLRSVCSANVLSWSAGLSGICCHSIQFSVRLGARYNEDTLTGVKVHPKRPFDKVYFCERIRCWYGSLKRRRCVVCTGQTGNRAPRSM